MEVTPLSVGKSVLDGALGYAQSAIADEVTLQLGVQKDHAFIRDELDMMRSFLMVAHEEREYEHKVLTTWVKQVRDVAYDAEDCLQDCSIHLQRPSCWRLLRTLLERRRIGKKMKELRARVEDVSQRNLRYGLIKGSGSKLTTTAAVYSSMASATMSGIEESRRQQEKAKADLVQLMDNKGEDLGVVAVCGASALLGDTSIVKRAYNDLKGNERFKCYAWVRIMHPFKPEEFLQDIIRQFYVDSLELGTKAQKKSGPTQDLLMIMGRMKGDSLVDGFINYLHDKSYLIVLVDLSTIQEWDQIKAFFLNNKKGSQLVVCTEHVEVASLCIVQENVLPKHKQLSTDETLYVFYDKGSQDGTGMTESGSSTWTADSNISMDGKGDSRMDILVATFQESQPIGRKNETTEINKMISKQSQEFEVISIYGMGGLGKTTLAKHIYQIQALTATFDKRACVTIKRPFNPEELVKTIAMQLKDKKRPNDDRTKQEEKTSMYSLLEGKKFLIVLDDLSSTTEWDALIPHFPKMVTASRIIVTTRDKNIAKHCSKKEENIYQLNTMEDDDARNLFTEKVFNKTIDLKKHAELLEEAKFILKKCGGLPLAIVTIGGFLAKQPKTPEVWRKLNEHISAELEMHPELGMIRNILIKSYDGLPYHLKSCFLYLSIFPEDNSIRRRRLVRRWIAEGYSREVRGKSLEDIADMYFMELIDRSMILPFQESIASRKEIDSCYVHDLMREISISKSTEENLVFRMGESCNLNNAQCKVRHLVVSSNWAGNRSEFESAVDLSRIRSLTLFGKWRPFFISHKMRMLRVLDLEGTEGLVNHHLEHIGKLLHLKYLSLRGCDGIFHLPDSLGNLKQLQTLDVSDTRIIKLPKTIVKLRKLQFIRGGDSTGCPYGPWEVLKEAVPALCLGCWEPQLMGDELQIEGHMSRRDVCTACCCILFPILGKQVDPSGILLPRGVRKLKALHTLGAVNIAPGKASILKDIRELSQLRKLEVIGIDQKNCRQLCPVLVHLSRLESLSLQTSSMVDTDLRGLDDMCSPPKSLKSLKLVGKLVELPQWIGELQNLVKLKLESTYLVRPGAVIRVLGKLHKLSILCLSWGTFQYGVDLRLNFNRDSWPSLMVLQLLWIDHNIRSMEFGKATPKLELLRFCGFREEISAGFISGLAYLPRLRAFELDNRTYEEEFLEDIKAQLDKNTNGPVLKRCNL